MDAGPVPVFSDWPDLLERSWIDRCVLLMDRLLGDELDGDALARAVRGALGFPLPLVELRPDLFRL